MIFVPNHVPTKFQSNLLLSITNASNVYLVYRGISKSNLSQDYLRIPVSKPILYLTLQYKDTVFIYVYLAMFVLVYKQSRIICK